MHKHVELVIGRLVTDPELRRRFAAQPREVLREQGLDLSEVELAALATIDPGALAAFAAALDTRLRKAALACERGGIGDPTPTLELRQELHP